MKRLLKTLLLLTAILIILVFIAKAFVGYSLRKTLPDYNAEIKLNNMTGTVTVYRDQLAIPHIYASNEEDLYRATGYVMAQDRLWQMDLLRRVTQGRLAEIFGADLLETDYLLRSLHFEEKSNRILDSSRHVVILCLEAFADGVNQFIGQNMDNLPVEFKLLGYKPDEWKPVHSVNLVSYMAWSLKAGWENILMEELQKKVGDKKAYELMPNTTRQQDVVFPRQLTGNSPNTVSPLISLFNKLEAWQPETFNASNNWSVSGNKTQTGSAILANDMHLGYNMPATWYMVHQVAEGTLNVSGLALPGAPLVVAGHNEFIAWGMTNTYVDNLDMYENKINPQDPDQYELDGAWKNFVSKNEVFSQKKGVNIIKEIRYDHRGPVISDFVGLSDKVVSIRWTGLDFSNELDAVYKLNRAYNWNDFREAIKGFRAISQNFNYADINGNIGIQCGAGVPIRDRAVHAGILPGWTSEYDWIGMVPYEKLPSLYNPSENYVASANNRTVNDNYPYHIGTWYGLPYRIQRINQVLNDSRNITMEDMAALQNDFKSLVAVKYMPLITEAIEANVDKLDNIGNKCLDMLKSWDFMLDKNSAAGLLFEKMYMQIITNLLKDEMGDELFKEYTSKTYMVYYAFENAFAQTDFSWTDNIETPHMEENLQDIIFTSFTGAVKICKALQGSNPENWSWGKAHLLRLEHPLGKVKAINWLMGLNSKAYPVGGSWHTVGTYAHAYHKPYNVLHGASHRHIFDLGDWDNSLVIMPSGNSGNSKSKHYTDQTGPYIQQLYHQENFSKAKVVANARYTSRITGK